MNSKSMTVFYRTGLLFLPIQEANAASPSLRQETLVPSRDQTHWNHAIWRKRGSAPRHEAGDIVEQVLDNLLSKYRRV